MRVSIAAPVTPRDWTGRAHLRAARRTVVPPDLQPLVDTLLVEGVFAAHQAQVVLALVVVQANETLRRDSALDGCMERRETYAFNAIRSDPALSLVLF